MTVAGKAPHQPQMGKSLNAAQCLGDTVFRLKDDGGVDALHKTALPRQTELGGKIAAQTGNYFQFKVILSVHAFSL